MTPEQINDAYMKSAWRNIHANEVEQEQFEAQFTQSHVVAGAWIGAAGASMLFMVVLAILQIEGLW